MPVVTIIGSNPIILHLDSGTPYTEQGAIALDEEDGDISDCVGADGNPPAVGALHESPGQRQQECSRYIQADIHCNEQRRTD